MNSILNNPLGIWGIIIAAITLVGFSWLFYQSIVDGGPDEEVESSPAEQK